MRYDINLASRPFVDARQFYRQWGLLLGGVALVTLLLCGLAFHRWNDSRSIAKEIRELHTQTEALRSEAEANRRVLNEEKNRPIREQARFLNAVVLQKSLSWTRVFSELERMMPPQVHLVSMEPQVDPSGQIAIQMKIAAASHEKALDFVRGLEASHQFRDVHVLSEATDDKPQTKPADRIGMSLTMAYAPARGKGAEIAQGGTER
jgi:Tfp pilus assembly protein PilN